MTRKRVNIPEDLSCPACGCGAEELIGSGGDFKPNQNGDNPPRIYCQRFKCKCCGNVWVSDIPKVKD